MDCLFCKIAKREMGADVVYEDEKAMAILDINPRTPGHVFVIPKMHVENLLDLPEVEVETLFLAVKATLKKVIEKLKADGATIGINQGKISGQEVAHLHIHIMPRFEGDGGKSVQSVVNNPPENKEEIKNKLIL